MLDAIRYLSADPDRMVFALCLLSAPVLLLLGA